VLAGSPGVTSQPEAAVARRDVADRAAKIFVVALFTMMAVNLGVDFAQTGRSTGLLLLASEALVVVLTICRRAPLAVDRSVRARVLTTMSLVGPPLVQPATTLPLATEMFTAVFAAIGLLIVIGGKMSLGRSFGLMPANRGIVSTGLYSLVRHPIYLGYLITHIGFLLAHPTPWNLTLLISSDLALLTRAVCEERTLAHDAEYRVYQQRVRWRVVPGLF
jgi:protein-S-isoprenylcysteine O-methyltransferase Ste14